jgi:hypothetical protein
MNEEDSPILSHKFHEDSFFTSALAIFWVLSIVEFVLWCSTGSSFNTISWIVREWNPKNSRQTARTEQLATIFAASWFDITKFQPILKIEFYPTYQLVVEVSFAGCISKVNSARIPLLSSLTSSHYSLTLPQKLTRQHPQLPPQASSRRVAASLHP